ncbi:MAG: DUF86 domain-containing protein [Geopsychrobacter sp.]|nr:DUF86 domain-containing protein [Geopsychrobacter sp.]
MKQSINYLHHILDETQFIIENSTNTGFDKFQQDPILQRAFIRSLEIIGEAVKNISIDMQEKYPNVEWRKMAATRNRLIHRYFSVDLELVWDIVMHKIPALQQQVEYILGQEKL